MLNLGRTNSEGVSFISKLSCLELLGALVLLVTCGDLAVGGHLRIHVDNQGAVDIFAKGHSATCGYTSAVALPTSARLTYHSLTAHYPMHINLRNYNGPLVSPAFVTRETRAHFLHSDMLSHRRT